MPEDATSLFLCSCSSKTRGRKRALYVNKETITKNALTLLASHTTPLCRSAILEIVQNYFKNMVTDKRDTELLFVEERSSMFFLRGFLSRHQDVSF